MVDRKKILLYAGSDFSTLLTLNKLIPSLVDDGIEPIMVFPSVQPSTNENAMSAEMKEFSFFDRGLVQNTVIPFMNSNEIITAVGKDKKTKLKEHLVYTPQQLCKHYSKEGVQAYSLNDVNSSEHLSYIQGDEKIIGGISIRCLQIFDQPIIDAHSSSKELPNNKNGFLWNVHPGQLPNYRGLMPLFRAAAENNKIMTWTLHAIEDSSIDTGTVYAEVHQSVKKDKSMLWHYAANAENVSAMVLKNVGDVLNHGAPLTQRTQDKSEGAYYSYPSTAEIKIFKQEEKVWVGHHDEESRYIANAFANSSRLRSALNAVISEAVEKEFPTTKISHQKLEVSADNSDTPHPGMAPLSV